MANEKRLIDEFKNEVMWQFIELCQGNDFNKLSLLEIGETIDLIYEKYSTLPTVDAVEVVRCKDCKWYAPNNGGSWLGCAFDTRHPDDVPKAEDFCSYGERKDGDGDD